MIALINPAKEINNYIKKGLEVFFPESNTIAIEELSDLLCQAKGFDNELVDNIIKQMDKDSSSQITVEKFFLTIIENLELDGSIEIDIDNIVEEN